MSIAKWTCGAMFLVVCAATAACGAPADGSESTEENQAAETKVSGATSKEAPAAIHVGENQAKDAPDLGIGRTPICPVGEKVVCTLFPVVCHCEATVVLPIGRVE